MKKIEIISRTFYKGYINTYFLFKTFKIKFFTENKSFFLLILLGNL